MPEVIEESFETEVLEEKENIQPNPTPVQRVGRPRKTIAQYKRDKQLLQEATPAPLPMPITQDDEINAVSRELPHMVTMRTPSGITQHAIGAIVNTTIENLHAPAFIPYKLRKSTMQYEQIMLWSTL
jgi:hypothetical protein